jgi:hypothetical protein
MQAYDVENYTTEMTSRKSIIRPESFLATPLKQVSFLAFPSINGHELNS